MDLNAIDKKSAAIGACAAVVIWIIGGWMFGGDSSSSAKWYDYGNGAINLSRVGQVSATLTMGPTKLALPPSSFALSDASYDDVISSFKNACERAKSYANEANKAEDLAVFAVYVELNFDDVKVKVSEGTCRNVGEFKDVCKDGLRAYESVLDLVK